MKVEAGLTTLLQQLNQNNGQVRNTANSHGSAADNAKGTSENSGMVQLGAVAQAISKAEASIAEQPIVDSNRVAALASAIADGSYQVDSQQVAERTFNMEVALEGKLAA